MKNCSKCKIEKPTSEFYPDKRLNSGIASSCKSCHAIKRAKLRENDHIVFYHIKKRYGLTRDDYESMSKQQDHKCKLCLSKIESYYGRNKDKLVVDHCHTTGKVRGLLCAACNLLIGHIEKRGGLEFLTEATKYLREH